MKRLVRGSLWAVGILAALLFALFLAFRLSPWPSVAIIQYAFAQGYDEAQARLALHVPADITNINDISYGPGADDRLDVNYQTGVQGAQRTVVWVHGGGFVSGDKAGVAKYLQILAGQGFTTVGVEYSTGFGSRYPKPVEQVNAALGYLVANAAQYHIDPDRLILAGDSAGAQISAQVALVLTTPDYAAEMAISPAISSDQLKAVALVSGAFDMASVDASGPYGWFVTTVLWAYSGTRDFLNDPRFRLASVVEHVGSQFPPSFITSGNGDPLEPQARELARVVETAGVPLRTLFFPPDHEPKLPHEYQFDLDLAEGQQALEELLLFINAQVPM